MQYARIENTDIHVSRVGFGTASLHHLYSTQSRHQLLEAAYGVGITHFDTAPYYGYGLAESELGKFIKTKRSSVTVTTKVGLYPWGPYSISASSVWVRKAIGKIYPRISLPVVDLGVNRARDSLRASLRRLQTDYVDFLLLHEPDPMFLEADEVCEWLISEQAIGTIRAWGVAGLAANVRPWTYKIHQLGKVIQTQDSLDSHQADFMLEANRKLQFTYGYFSSVSKPNKRPREENVMLDALRRNSTGSVLMATRRHDRFNKILKFVQ